METLDDYKKVIEYKILKELKGRKRSIQPLPEELLDKLFAMFQKGAVIDFEKSTTSGVYIHPIGEISSISDIHRLLDRHRKRTLDSIWLGYNTDTKIWLISQIQP